MMLKTFYSLLLICFLSACGFHPDYATALHAHKNQDYTTAKTHFEPLADFGLPEAQSYLGRMYYKGEGVEKDLDRAYTLFQKAADKNHPTAYFYLGQFAEKGLKGKKDGAKALDYYQMAGQYGFRPAPFYAGRLYHQGTLVKQDISKALTSYQQALDNKYTKAAYQVGKIYEKGEGAITPDLNKAMDYYKIAAKTDYAPAQKAVIRVSKKLKKKK